jgi:glycosyltransferase involved in cell wall biosynthesis
MKRVLMLAYFFPPSKAAGTFRTLRFVRDLPACGWTPSVLTVRPEAYPPADLDPALLHKVPAATRVHRTPAPAYHRWYKRTQERLKGLRPGPAPGPAAPPSAAAPGGAPAAPPRLSPLDVVYMLCRTPDIDAGWYGFALAHGLGVVLRERPQVLYASGGPWTTFRIARDLSLLSGVPLVLDYRDPWTSNPSVLRHGSWFEDLALRLERGVVRRARCIVANTDVLRETLMETHGDAVGDKTVVIHNSYDAADYADPAPPRSPLFTLAYVGALYDAHSPESFLRALAGLVARRPEVGRKLRVQLVGPGAARTAARVRALGLDAVVDVREPVPHAEAVRLQRAAHALLLFLTVPSDRSTFVPSKLFEYVAARRPIFAVTRGGALERLLRGRQLTPWIYRPEDADGMEQGLLNLLERHERGCLPQLSEPTVRGFSGEAAAQALSGVLEAASAGRRLVPFSPPATEPSPATAPGAAPVEWEAR